MLTSTFNPRRAIVTNHAHATKWMSKVTCFDRTDRTNINDCTTLSNVRWRSQKLCSVQLSLVALSPNSTRPYTCPDQTLSETRVGLRQVRGPRSGPCPVRVMEFGTYTTNSVRLLAACLFAQVVRWVRHYSDISWYVLYVRKCASTVHRSRGRQSSVLAET